MSDCVLAIDQGTTGTTCLVIRVLPGPRVELLGKGYTELPQHFPQPGWVEHDLEEIWVSTIKSMALAIGNAGIKGQQIAAIGITNQRETTALWNRKGEPVSRAIVWQDRRTASMCEELKQAGHAELFRSRTGLVIDPYFSGTKLAWLLKEIPAARQRAEAGDLLFGTIDSYLTWRLTGGKAHVTDATNASRTLMYDISKGCWDETLCQALGGIPAKILPEVRDSSGIYATTQGVEGLPDGVPISGIAGDQHAALFGQCCFTPGMAKCTYGTGAFALINTGSRMMPSEHGLVTTIAWRLGGDVTYALEGSAFIAGAVVQWLRDGLGFFDKSEEIEALAREVPDSGGVVVVPALVGLGAPHWRPEARGLISGITRGTTRAHIARAALEGIALQIYDLLDAMRQDANAEITTLRVDGGAAANDLLMQIQADLLGVEIRRPASLETTAWGAAFLAALGVGMFGDPSDVSQAWQLGQCFESKVSRDAAKEQLKLWHEAVARC